MTVKLETTTGCRRWPHKCFLETTLESLVCDIIVVSLHLQVPSFPLDRGVALSCMQRTLEQGTDC